ncbi:hypothetical protein AK812_SmicGene3805 [Symbiodinium microadriaticum]|uniref:Uncharacterized protein n=1 Tax=Symbiodinium microadriaticum TaxID=2951 RepID=A0A1Q9EXW7_SYMMI|nr:hypothetical protein AK812_SmicGene3805 [Symbiodinium microadriaticum]
MVSWSALEPTNPGSVTCQQIWDQLWRFQWDLNIPVQCRQVVSSSASELTKMGSLMCRQIWDQFQRSQQANIILVRCVQMVSSSALDPTWAGNVMCQQIWGRFLLSQRDFIIPVRCRQKVSSSALGPTTMASLMCQKIWDQSWRSQEVNITPVPCRQMVSSSASEIMHLGYVMYQQTWGQCPDQKLQRRITEKSYAFAQTVDNPLEPMAFDLFCHLVHYKESRLCGQIGFDAKLAKFRISLRGRYPKLSRDKEILIKKVAADMLQLGGSRLELRYGSVAEAFEEAEYLDAISFTDMLSSVGATPAEAAKRFFAQFVRHMPKSRAKVSRHIFLTVLGNAEGISAAERLRRGLGLDLKEAENADEAKRPSWSKGDNTLSYQLVVLIIYLMQGRKCSPPVRHSYASAPVGSDQDYYGEQAMLPEPPEETEERRRRRRYVSLAQAYGYGSVGLARHLRQQMAVSVADAASKIKRGQPHDVAASLSSLLAVRPVPSLRELSLRSDVATPRSVSTCSQYDFLT